MGPESRGIPNMTVMDNTNVYLHKFKGSGEYLTFTDFHLSNRLHDESLHTLGNTKFNDNLKGIFSGSHYGEYFDKATGENVIVNWLGEPKFGGINLIVYKMGSDLVRYSVGSVDIKFIPYSIHSVVVSGDYAFVVVSPVEIDLLKSGATMCLSCSARDNLDSRETIIYVFCLDESFADQTVKRIVSPEPFFSFHHINAVTEGNNTQLDLCIYTSMDGVLGTNVLGNFKDIFDPTTRNSMASFCTNVWRLNINVFEEKVSSIMEIPMVDVGNKSYHGELMKINPKHIGKPYCFFYALTTHMNYSELYEDIGVLKVDACGNKGVLSSFYQPGIYPGEPIFVPDPNSTKEDQGVLLVLTRAGKADVSRLLVLDASNLSHVIAEIAAPFKHMFDFHGKFFPK